MKYTRPTDGLDNKARKHIEGANDNAADGIVRLQQGIEGAGFFIDVTPNAKRMILQADEFHIGDHSSSLAPAATQPQPLVIIESPYGGDHERNAAYARVCLLDSLERGEAPIASHLLHTQVLDDDVPNERKMGIEAGLAWYRVADKCVVYAREGITKGMLAGIARAQEHGVLIEFRDDAAIAEGEVAA